MFNKYFIGRPIRLRVNSQRKEQERALLTRPRQNRNGCLLGEKFSRRFMLTRKYLHLLLKESNFARKSAKFKWRKCKRSVLAIDKIPCGKEKLGQTKATQSSTKMYSDLLPTTKARHILRHKFAKNSMPARLKSSKFVRLKTRRVSRNSQIRTNKVTKFCQEPSVKKYANSGGESEEIDIEGHTDEEAIVPSDLTKGAAASWDINSIILTPHFRPVSLPLIRVFVSKSKNLKLDYLADDFYLKMHRPMELKERRARKREDELARYREYISQLRQNAPELWPHRT